MKEESVNLQDFFSKITANYGLELVKALLIFVIGFLAVRFLSKALEKLVEKYHSAYGAMILSKIIHYVGLFLVVMISLDKLGINTTQIIAAAGVLGVAVGFASQTSVSNIISGIFLIAEKPFVLGDRIQVGSLSGRIVAIDLLSVKLVSADNDYVRIPNEYLIKNSFINLTRYSTRRMSVQIDVSYEDNLNQVLEVLNNVISKNKYNQDSNKSSSFVTQFKDSSIMVTAYMWIFPKDIFKAKSTLLIEAKKAFEDNGIEIPSPQLVIHQKEAKTVNS